MQRQFNILPFVAKCPSFMNRVDEVSLFNSQSPCHVICYSEMSDYSELYTASSLRRCSAFIPEATLLCHTSHKCWVDVCLKFKCPPSAENNDVVWSVRAGGFFKAYKNLKGSIHPKSHSVFFFLHTNRSHSNSFTWHSGAEIQLFLSSPSYLDNMFEQACFRGI